VGRCLRFVPEGGALVEVTTRTIQGRLLLRPSPATNEIVLGVLGRAQRIYDVGISAVVVLSNHYHCLLRIRDAKQLRDFMCYFNSNLAREIGRLVGWRDKIWSRRFTAVVISAEPEAQRSRLKYLLGHGVKEFLVDRTREWPGVHSVRALLDDEPLAGYWFDRTQEFAARQRGEDFRRLDFAERETVTLSPLPCWEGLPADEQKRRVAEVVHEVESEAGAHRDKTGTTPMGAAAIRKQNPHDQPQRSKKSPAPLFHAASKRVRDDLRADYYAFLAAFREAAERLKAGILPVVFPAGSFPPGLPFVGG